MSYLSRLKAEAEKRPDGEPSKPSKGASEPFEGSRSEHFGGLPADIADGLGRLQNMRPPSITIPSVWSEIVEDAVRLVAGGWAAQALGLGWEPLQLWGASVETPGLAVELAGRRIVDLKADRCVMRNGNCWSWFKPRPPAPDAVLLWELGKDLRCLQSAPLAEIHSKIE